MTANASSFYLANMEVLAEKHGIIQFQYQVPLVKYLLILNIMFYLKKLNQKNKIAKICLGLAIQKIGQEKYLLLIIIWILMLGVIQLKIWMVRKY